MANKRKKSSNSGRKKQKNGDKETEEHETIVEEENAEKTVAEGTEFSESLSLSVEDTNKLRAQLGLAPLETDDSNKKQEFVHVPAKNASEEALAEKYREKIRLNKERRELLKSLDKVQKLDDVDHPDDIDSVTAWVNRSRTLPKPKLKISKEKVTEYKGSSLMVEHLPREFETGGEAILTLKDTDVLKDEEDALVDIGLIEARKARENVKNRVKLSNYNPYDDYDEETGDLKPAQLLSKYDEEIYGKTVHKFRIEPENRTKSIHVFDDSNDQNPQTRLQESLQTSLKFGSDLMTTQEYDLKFKNSKKRKGKQKIRSVITGREVSEISLENQADYLEPEDTELELQDALERVRKAKLKQRTQEEFITSSTVQQDYSIPFKTGMTLDLVSEFVRSHEFHPASGSIDTVKVETVKNKPTETPQSLDEKSEVKAIKSLVEEIPLNRGLGSAITLLSQRGYIQDFSTKEIKIETNIPKIDPVVDRERMKSLHRGGYRRDSGNDDYKFDDIDVGYYDKHGVLLDPKDAFREVSYKFHGKKPSKKKLLKRIEKREGKIDSDPAKAIKLIVEKQKKNQSPFLVLSGSNINLFSQSDPTKKT